MRTTRICIGIDSTVLDDMRDLYARLMAQNHADKRTFEEWVADIAVYGQERDRKWLERYER